MTWRLSPSTARAFGHCREVTRRRARNFYYGLKLSPEPQRSALFAVYAWMREADDIVDSANNADRGALHEEVTRFRNATDAALAGKPAQDHPVWIALAETAARFHLPREHFHAMLEGQLDDAARREYDTFEQLRSYCYRVASTVGLICIEIWGYENDAARDLAFDRGIAFQMTNILRDYKQDFDAGRLYLPREDFAHFEITPRILREWSQPTACAALMALQVERAETFYARSHGLEDLITPGCRPTLWAMTAIYRGLLAKIKNDPSRLIRRHRVRLSTFRKGAIALRARWQARTRRGSVALSENAPA